MSIVFVCKSNWNAESRNDWFSFLVFRAGDITELKILEIPGPGDSRQCGELQQADTGIPGVGCQVGPSQNGTGKMLKKPFSSSAPQSIPRRTDMKNQDIIISPQQQCSKSYMDRHMETLTQSKGFRRRHNSCEYVCSHLTFLPAWVTTAIYALVQQEYSKQKFYFCFYTCFPKGLGKRKVNGEEILGCASKYCKYGSSKGLALERSNVETKDNNMAN